MSYEGLIAAATYICYKFNRELTPNITPEGWVCVFPNALEMERQYQAEKSAITLDPNYLNHRHDGGGFDDDHQREVF